MITHYFVLAGWWYEEQHDKTSGVAGKKILRTYYFFISLANVGGPIACWFLNRKLYLQTLHN